MMCFRAICVVCLFILAGAEAHAGVIDYARSCWRALVGTETAAGLESQIAEPPVPQTTVVLAEVAAPIPRDQAVSHGVYRQSAKPQSEERESTAGVRFVRDYSNPALGEAWRAVNDNELHEGLIWGDAVRGTDGSIHYIPYDEAVEYCIGLNPRSKRDAIRAALESGQAPEQGIYLPQRSDFKQLRRQLGFKDTDFGGASTGYEEQILPHLDHMFWSSSRHEMFLRMMEVYSGSTGGFALYSHDFAKGLIAVRCVARR